MGRSKYLNMLISLLLAILLWGIVVVQVNPQVTETFNNVPVTFLGEDSLAEPDLVRTGPEQTSVEVTVKGTRADVRGMDKEDIRITADLTGLTEGEHTVRLSVSAPTTVRVTEVEPDRIKVTIGTRKKGS